jgi:inhibitor of cysteine peptidase
MESRFALAAILAALILAGCGSAGGAVNPNAGGGPDQPVGSDDAAATMGGVVNSDQPAPSPTPPNPADTVIGLAVVDSLDVMLMESFPLQVQASIKGNLPDGCTTIGAVDQKFDEGTKTFTLTIQTYRPKGMACIMVVAPYEKNVALEVYGLSKGTYTVIANGKSATFELASDNILPELATP